MMIESKEYIFHFKFFLVTLLIFAIIGFGFYYRVLPSYFLSDDFGLIGRVSEGGYYNLRVWIRPVIIMSYLMDYHIWSFQVIGYHLTNIFFHVMNAWLVSIFTIICFKVFGVDKLTPNKVIFILPGLYFLLLPCHSEAVSWISGRTDVIATFFILLSLIFSSLYFFMFQYWQLILTLIFFIIALCTKESALAVPLIILVLAGFSCIQASPYPIKIRLVKILQLCLPSVGIVIVYFLLRYVLIGTFIGGYGTYVHVNFSPEVVLSNLVRYSMRVFMPPLSSPEYGKVLHQQNLQILGIHGIVGFISICLITLLVKLKKLQWLLLTRQRKIIGLLLLSGIFIIALFPVIRIQLFILSTPIERIMGISLTLSIIFSMALTLWFQLTKYERICNVLFFLLLIGCFFLATLPVISMEVSLFDTQNERFLYFPSIFASIGMIFIVITVIQSLFFRRIIFFIVIVFSAYHLWNVNEQWVLAGQISQNILTTLVEQTTRPDIVILNLPDNLNGAYIFRNGLTRALKVFMKAKHIHAVYISAYQNLNSNQDTFELIQTNTILPSFSLFLHEQSSLSLLNRENKYLDVSQPQQDHLEFYLKDHDNTSEYDMFMYSSGAMKKVIFPQIVRSEVEQ